MMDATELTPPEAAQNGTNTALLGGLLFLTLFFAFVVITVVVIFFCYCRKAKGERYKYRGQPLEEGRRRQRTDGKQKQNNGVRHNPLDNFITTRDHSPGVSTTGMLSVDALQRVAARYDNSATAPRVHGVRYDNTYSKHFASRIQNDTRADNGTRLDQVTKPKPETSHDVIYENRKTPKQTEYKHAVDDNREKTPPNNENNAQRSKLYADKVYTPPELRKLPPVPGHERNMNGTSTEPCDNLTSSDEKTETLEDELFLKKWQHENDVRRRHSREQLEDDLVFDSNVVYESTDIDHEQSADQLSEVYQPEKADVHDKHNKTDFHNVSERSRLPEVEALNELDKAVEGHLDGFQPISNQELNTRPNHRLPPLDGVKLPPVGGTYGPKNDANGDDVRNKTFSRFRRHSVSATCNDSDMTSSLTRDVASLSKTLRREHSSSFRHPRRQSRDLQDARAAHRRSLSSDRGPALSRERQPHEGRTNSSQTDSDSELRTRDGRRAEQRRARNMSRSASEERGRARNPSQTRSDSSNASRAVIDDAGCVNRGPESSNARSDDVNGASKTASGDTRHDRKPSVGRSSARHSGKTRSGHDDGDGIADGDKPSGDELRHHVNDNEETKRHRRHHHHHGDEHRSHRRHHHSRERGNHRNERSKDEQLDDLTMTLHAEDELYQLHKRAPGIDLGTESEREYSV